MGDLAKHRWTNLQIRAKNKGVKTDIAKSNYDFLQSPETSNFAELRFLTIQLFFVVIEAAVRDA